MGARVQTLKSIFTAETQPAEAGFAKMRAQTASFGQMAGGVFDGLGIGLKQFAGAAGLGAVIVTAGKTAIELEKMREESAQLEARFVGFAGSAAKAEAAMAAFDTAVGHAMTNDEKMAAAAQMTGLGLAATADEAAAMTQQALVLGMGVDELTQALETGRATGLVKYGIAVSDLKTKAEELQRANRNLSDQEAMAIAIKGQIAEKSRQIEAAGGQAATAIDQLANAWEDLKDAAADKVQLEVVIKGGTDVVSLMTDILRGPTAGAPEAVQASFDESALENAKRSLAEARQARADYVAELKLMEEQAHKAGGILPPNFGRDIELFDANVRKAEAAVQAAQDELTATRMAIAKATLANLDYGDSMAQMAEQAGTIAGAIGGVHTALADGDLYWAGWAGAAERAAANTMTAVRAVAGTTTGTFTVPSKTRWGLYADWAQPRVQQTAADDPVKAWQERMKAANRVVAKDAGVTWATAMQDAVGEFEGEFKSAMTGAISDSKGLLDLTPGGGNPNAPGANGFAEDIFRLQAFINDGSWGETAGKYGLDQAGATEVVKKFQSGMWDQSVLDVLNMDQLKEQIKQEQVAKQLMDALAADLAAETQGDPKLIKALLGMGGGGDGGQGAAASAAGLDLTGFTSGFLASVDQDIAANAADLEKRGAALWEKLGGGFVTAASKSGAFKSAVTALVEQALVDSLA